MLVLPCCPTEDESELVPVKTRLAMIIEYDGTDYAGFQWQDGKPTIQQQLEGAIYCLTGEKTRVVSASRTDAGVHAENQVVTFWSSSKLPSVNIIGGLNHFLPSTIVVKSVVRAAADFHVQRSAVSRQYDYIVLNRLTRSPLQQRFAWHVRSELDIEKMRETCRYLVGVHDFASFTNSDSPMLNNTIREMHSAEVVKRGESVVFTFLANSFLTHQIRNTVGTLIKVGQNKMSPQEFYSIMEQKQIGLAGPKAPARGLHLVRVNYSRPIEEESYENV